VFGLRIIRTEICEHVAQHAGFVNVTVGGTHTYQRSLKW